MSALTALIRRDLRIAIRAGGGALIGVLFFLTVVVLMPFALGPDLPLLKRIGPAILWIGALLASLLGLDRLFQADREDGSLDLMILAADGHMLALTVLTKCLAHWTASVLPLMPFSTSIWDIIRQTLRPVCRPNCLVLRHATRPPPSA